ncbi:MAG: hypothetical protein ACP5FZ_09795 [Fidelibacterota bacterium]
MIGEVQILELLASNFNLLRLQDSLNEKCQILLDTLRKSGWGRVSLSFLNSKYETKKTLYSGYSDDLIKIAEEKKLNPAKRKELLSSLVERYRISTFYYLPWKDSRARTIIASGRTTEIPIDAKNQWHPMDLLYAPLYYKSRPVAVLILDEPKDKATPDKVKMRVPQIIHSTLIQVIAEYISQEYFSYSEELREAIIAKGTLGVIEIAHDGKIRSLNLAGEHILRLRSNKIESLYFLKNFNDRFANKIAPVFTEAQESLQPQTFTSVYFYSDGTSRELVLQFFPQHVLYEYSGMICTISYPKSQDMYQIYADIVTRLKEMSESLIGDFPDIQQKVIFLLCRQFHFRFPRIYAVSDDQSTLKCLLTFDEETQDLEFFDHAYNRNSLGATAIIDNQIVFTTKEDKQIRDVRRIWQKLDTPGAIAIPIYVNENRTCVLVCDFLEPGFELDTAKEILLKYFALVLGMTLKPYFSN